MEIEELDNALDELEVRLERLRALYEQYFLGIEKIEPTIARKDVDRRIFVLRREKVRNTGKRFKLQTLIQRYNTFQQYWQRICREIENGTYRRHLLRAERNVGPTELLTIAARRRFGKEREAATARERPPAEAGPEVAPHPSSVPAPERPSHPQNPPTLETPTLPRGTHVPPLPALTAPPLPSDLRARVASSSPPPMQMPASLRPSKSTPPRSYESLELDMDFMGDWDPANAPRAAKDQPKGARLAPPPKPGRAGNPPPKPSRPPPPVAPLVAAPRVEMPPTEEEPQRRRPQRSTHPGLAPPPPGTPGPMPAVVPPRAKEPPGAAARETHPAARRAPTTHAAAAPAPAAPSSLTEERLKTLHSRLLEETKKTNLPSVSLEGMSRSLRAAETKLRTQHGNRRIDFEVVMKDGKPVLKPVVR